LLTASLKRERRLASGFGERASFDGFPRRLKIAEARMLNHD